jgi:alkanesulfonate monooxygenase SsuD/methylene tetrahydromethanopterin reductase-like flavin-dependent oxidoreductase (luciferase family)
MQLGIHLPHAGERATPALIRRHAMRAEDLGFADIWVSEHIIVPLDEGIAMMRAVWSQDPVTFHAKYISATVREMTMLPHPVSPIPLWIGGSADAALKRAIRIADGWHGSRESPEEAALIVQRLRAAKPDNFTISMRIQWNGKDQGELRDRLAAYEVVGVQHVLVAPVNREVDDWDEVIEGAGRLVGR